jgi:hypothetical protein
MTGTGTYPQVVAFMTLLDRMARTVVLDQVNLSSSGNGSLTVNLTAQIFYASAANS